MKLATHLHLLSGYECVELHPIPQYVFRVECLSARCLHGMVLSLAQGQIYLYLNHYNYSMFFLH